MAAFYKEVSFTETTFNSKQLPDNFQGLFSFLFFLLLFFFLLFFLFPLLVFLFPFFLLLTILLFFSFSYSFYYLFLSVTLFHFNMFINIRFLWMRFQQSLEEKILVSFSLLNQVWRCLLLCFRQIFLNCLIKTNNIL